MVDAPAAGAADAGGVNAGGAGSGGAAGVGGSGGAAFGGAGSGGAPGGSRASMVVGVFPGQPSAVLQQAADFASRFGAVLVCVFVDQTRYVVARNDDGTVISASMDPDLDADLDLGFPAELDDTIAGVLDPQGIRWRTLRSAGDPADALSAVAEVVDAFAIVVGTRRGSARSSVAEFFNGSVAVHLAHRQHRAVIVVPVAPVAHGEPLPWPSA